MLTIKKKQQIQESIQSLTASHAAVVAQISFLIDTLELEVPTSSVTSKQPVADEATFCISWQGRNCFLGNTLLFRMFHRLARSTNRYVTHLDLLDDVWHEDRETSTIRNVVKRLRDQLIAADMKELASAINGVSGHYGLFLD